MNNNLFIDMNYAAMLANSLAGLPDGPGLRHTVDKLKDYCVQTGVDARKELQVHLETAITNILVCEANGLDGLVGNEKFNLALYGLMELAKAVEREQRICGSEPVLFVSPRQGVLELLDELGAISQCRSKRELDRFLSDYIAEVTTGYPQEQTNEYLHLLQWQLTLWLAEEFERVLAFADMEGTEQCLRCIKLAKFLDKYPEDGLFLIDTCRDKLVVYDGETVSHLALRSDIEQLERHFNWLYLYMPADLFSSWLYEIAKPFLEEKVGTSVYGVVRRFCEKMGTFAPVFE